MVRSLLLAVLAVGGQSSEQCEDAGDVLKDETSLLQLHRRELMGRALQSETTAGHAVEKSLVDFSEYDCGDDGCEASGFHDPGFGTSSGHCSKCGAHRACCRTNFDTDSEACAPINIIHGADPMLHPQIIDQQHVCRDTKYREGGGSVTDAERREFQPGEFDCWSECNKRSGHCNMCGPDPYKPLTNRVCCRPDWNNIAQEECMNVATGETPHHVCRSSLPPPATGPTVPVERLTQGEWVKAVPDSFGGDSVELEFTVGVTVETGGSDEKSVFEEMTTTLEMGFSSPVGPSVTVGFSSSTGTEISKSKTWNRAVSEEHSISHGFQSDGGRSLWQWRMKSLHNDKVHSAWIIQTKDVNTKPACVPRHFAWGTGSSPNGAQFCQYGYRLDGTGGNAGFKKDKCHGRPQLDATNKGDADEFRGWYDVTGCGEALDFCRWTGKFFLGDPRLYGLQKSHSSFWKCLLSDGDDVAGIDLPGWKENIAGPRPKWNLETKEMEEQTSEEVEDQPQVPEDLRVWNFHLMEHVSAPAPPPPPSCRCVDYEGDCDDHCDVPEEFSPSCCGADHDQDDYMDNHYYW